MYDLIVTYSLFFQMTYALIIDVLDKDDGGKNGKILQLIFQLSLFIFILVSWIQQVFETLTFLANGVRESLLFIDIRASCIFIFSFYFIIPFSVIVICSFM